MGIVDKLKHRYRSSYLRPIADIIGLSAVSFHFTHRYFVNWTETTVFIATFLPLTLGILLHRIADYRLAITSKTLLNKYPNIKRTILFSLVAIAIFRHQFTDSLLLFGIGAEVIIWLILLVANEVTIITDRKVKSADAS